MAHRSVVRFAPLGTRLTVFGFTVWIPILASVLLSEILPEVVGGVLIGVTFVVMLVLCLGSSLSLTDEHLLIRNPFRTTELRWDEVRSIEPSRAGDRGSDLLVAVTAQGRHRIAVTLGAGRRGTELVEAFRQALGTRQAERILAFRPPARPAWWSRARSNWRPVR